jgi:clan AA aspartic protease (TIGR02281 family)
MQIIALVLGIWLLGTETPAVVDCTKATLQSSIAICSDPELLQPVPGPTNRREPRFDYQKAPARLALLNGAAPALSRFSHAHRTLFRQVGADRQPGLKEEDCPFLVRVQEQCALPHSKGFTPEIWQAPDCVQNAYGVLGGADARALEQRAGSPAAPSVSSLREQDVPLQAAAMQLPGETYVIPVRINGAITLPFTVDSGASDVLVPEDVVRTLARIGMIADSDFIGDQTYTLADGTIIKSLRFMLRELQVGDQDIRNVTAIIGPMDSKPLLGQSFLSRFSSWTLDNERHALVLGEQRPVFSGN